MSTNDETAPIPTAGRARSDDPTAIFETFAPEPEPATRATGRADRTDAAGPAEPAPTRSWSTGAAPGTPGAGATAALPVAGPAGPTDPAGPTYPTYPADPTGPVDGPPPAPRPEDAAPAERGRPGVRVSTVVWGLVLAVIGVGVLAVAAGAVIDLELALIGLLALAGVALVAGSVAAGVRRRR